jgi:hypothetical protein
MNTIELFENWKRKILEIHPRAEIHCDIPEKEDGTYFFDIECIGPILTVEYRPGKGIGFYDDDTAYGEGPVSIVENPDEAFTRILGMLAERAHMEATTVPMVLSEK